jgi:hypothetical protein
VGLWMAAGRRRRWRRASENLKIWDIESWFSKKKIQFFIFYYFILFYNRADVAWHHISREGQERAV